MAIFAALDVYVEVNSVDLSDHVESVELNEEYAALETTAFSNTARTRIAGLNDGSITISFLQDYDAASVYATLAAAQGTLVDVTVRPTSAAAGATNPEFSADYLVTEVHPLPTAVGEVVKLQVTWPRSGVLTTTTA